jgi:hypothetical protein
VAGIILQNISMNYDLRLEYQKMYQLLSFYVKMNKVISILSWNMTSYSFPYTHIYPKLEYGMCAFKFLVLLIEEMTI